MNAKQNDEKLMETMSRVAKKSQGIGLKNAAQMNEVEKLATFLDCSAHQALFFSLVVYLSVTESQPRYKDIAKYLGHDPFDMMNHVADMRALQKRGIIRKSRDVRNEGITDVNFYVPADVIEALTDGSKGIMKNHRLTDSESLFARIYKLMSLVEEEVIIHTEMHDEIMGLVLEYPELPTFKNLSKYKLEEWDLILLLSIGAEVMKGESIIDMDDILKAVLNDAADRFRIKKALMRGNHILIRKNLVALESSFFASDRNIILTDKSMKELFDAEFSLVTEQKQDVENIFHPSGLRKRKLFFNAAETRQLQEISSSLTSASYRRIRKGLEEHNLPSGMNILFYGTPGTGKTEAVYQLARRLNKKIFKVDISQTKDLFFGESEKRVKKLFETYREWVKAERNCPILLFNEADGVLSKRKDSGSSAVSQTENAMQNILLEEMEHLEGIMVATTNLTSNLDKAFERRFLYKVRFNQPGQEVRAKIWKEHIPGLKPAVAQKLAGLYGYSGGEIANIARKMISAKILRQSSLTLENIIEFCEDERIEGERIRVGY